MYTSTPMNPSTTVLGGGTDRAMAALEAELATLVEPCPLCDLSSLGPCPACDGKGWIALESPAQR